MRVNLKGPWLVVRACSPFLVEGSGIVDVASATVFSGSGRWMHSVASKGGVIAMTRVMAKELIRRGVTANTFAPGFTLTDASYAHIENAEEYGVERGSLRRPALAEDIVGGVLFLTPPERRFITGQTLIVDGGRQSMMMTSWVTCGMTGHSQLTPGGLHFPGSRATHPVLLAQLAVTRAGL